MMRMPTVREARPIEPAVTDPCAGVTCGPSFIRNPVNGVCEKPGSKPTIVERNLTIVY